MEKKKGVVVLSNIPLIDIDMIKEYKVFVKQDSCPLHIEISEKPDDAVLIDENIVMFNVRWEKEGYVIESYTGCGTGKDEDEVTIDLRGLVRKLQNMILMKTKTDIDFVSNNLSISTKTDNYNHNSIIINVYANAYDFGKDNVTLDVDEDKLVRSVTTTRFESIVKRIHIQIIYYVYDYETKLLLPYSLSIHVNPEKYMSIRIMNIRNDKLRIMVPPIDKKSARADIALFLAYPYLDETEVDNIDEVYARTAKRAWNATRIAEELIDIITVLLAIN